MKIIRTVFVAAFGLISVSVLSGQNLPGPLTGGTVQDLKNSNSLLYLNTDRSYYLPGESVMFKTYILKDSENKTSSLNDTLYVALLDQEGLEVSSGIVPLNNSIITGKIELPDFLSEGNYILVASARSKNKFSPEKMFSRIIEIRESVESDLITDLSLADTLYESGSLLTAQIKFTGKGNKPVPVSFAYQLTGTSGEILGGKSKANSDGIATLKLQLPVSDNKEVLKLIVTPSHKGAKTITGIVIPTPFNFTKGNKQNVVNIPVNEIKHFDILLKTIKLQDDKVGLEISLIDEKGNPVMANMSVSASNIIPHQLFYSNNITNFAYLNNNQPEFTSETDVRKYYAGILLQYTQSPGKPFIVQEKNNPKKLSRKGESGSQKKQYGYSTDRSIYDILMSIKPYHIENGKITFGIGTMNSLNNLDGALIIVDGIKMGTDASILGTIPVQDIAHISASTNVMDIQRYSSMNSVGIIEITMKKSGDLAKKEGNAAKTKSNILFWEPNVMTDRSGKTSVSFLNNNQSDELLITVEGVAANGLSGSSILRYTGK
ncbi:MAG: hypothetical protein ABR927_10440 [Bacteroidales bacterium]|jgi:hypothetical protein